MLLFIKKQYIYVIDIIIIEIINLFVIRGGYILKKMIKIVLKDLKIFASQKTSAFIVLIISLITASYAFSFFISNNMHMAKIINEYKNPSTKYYIGNNNGIERQKIEDLQKWLFQNEFQDTVINVYSNIEKTENNTDRDIINEENKIVDGYSVSGNLTASTDSHTSYNIIIGSNNNESKRVSFVGQTISQEDMDNKSNYAMIEYINLDAHKTPFIINKEIDVRGEKYIVKAIDRIDITSEIIRYSNTENYKNIQSITPVIIPISTFIEKYNTYTIDVKISGDLMVKDRNMIYEFLKENFAGSEIQQPIRTEDININDVSQNIILFTLLIILALINIIALFTYWVDKNWRKYMIYRICGASSRNIYSIVIIEALLIGLFAVTMGSIIYISYVLNIKEMLLIQVIILLAVILNTTFKAIKISKVNPKYIERRG